MEATIADMLRKVPMLALVNDAQLDILANLMTQVDLEKDDVLFHQGMPGGAMALIVQGKMAGRAHGLDGDAEVGTIYSGEIVGEMACIDSAPRAASVVATQTSTAVCLTAEGFHQLELKQPGLAIAIRRSVLQQINARLRQTNERIDSELLRRGIPPLQPTSEPDQLPKAGRARVDLRKVDRLAAFSDEELKTLIAMAPPLTYPDGYVLCIEGRIGTSAYIIAQGAVDVLRRLGTDDRLLAALGSGAMVGQMALIDDAPRSARVVVRGQSVILKLDRAPFQALLGDYSPFAMRLQHQIAVAGVRQLRSATEGLASLLTASGLRDALPSLPKKAESGAKAARRGQTQRIEDTERHMNTQELSYVRAATNEWGLALDGFGPEEEE